MAFSSSTQLLDLSQSIANATLLIAKFQLLEQSSLSTFHDHAVTNGVDGAMKEAQPVAGPQTKEVLDAKADLVQAASDLCLLVLGPANYLKTLSYSVSQPLQLHFNLRFVSQTEN